MSTKQDWFAVHNNLVDRQDLTIYEKMCCIVLARYADRSEFDNLLTLDVIANKMGCDKQSAERALFGLMSKGLLDLEDGGDGKILHQGQDEARQAKAPVFEVMAESELLEDLEDATDKTPDDTQEAAKEVTMASNEDLPEASGDDRVDEPKAEPSAEQTLPPKTLKKSRSKVVVNSDEYLMLLDQVYDIVQEKINEREARIILNFADHDLNVIKEKYAIARKSQISDTVEVLINELQKKPHHSKGEIPASPSSAKLKEPQEPVAEPVKQPVKPRDKKEEAPAVVLQPGGQINLVNINKMKMYKEIANQTEHLKGKGK